MKRALTVTQNLESVISAKKENWPIMRILRPLVSGTLDYVKGIQQFSVCPGNHNVVKLQKLSEKMDCWGDTRP